MAKKKAQEGQSVQWLLSAKEAAYINDLMDEEGFGSQPGTIVKSVFWEGLRSLIERGSITRREGKLAVKQQDK